MDFDFGNDTDEIKTIIEMVSKVIDNMPTAYDIDKVVEEIEKANQGCCNYCGCDLYSDDVIEIVKQGCVSDDVCEWKYDKHLEFAKSKCGSIDTHRIEFKKLKYCPYCGKKIKIEGDGIDE